MIFIHFFKIKLKPPNHTNELHPNPNIQGLRFGSRYQLTYLSFRIFKNRVLILKRFNRLTDLIARDYSSYQI